MHSCPVWRAKEGTAKAESTVTSASSSAVRLHSILVMRKRIMFSFNQRRLDDTANFLTCCDLDQHIEREFEVLPGAQGSRRA
jgi:hypothetical protein